MKVAHLAPNHKHIDNVINLFNGIELVEHVFFLEIQDKKMAEIPICNSNISSFVSFRSDEKELVANKLDNFDLVIVHCLTDLHAGIVNHMNCNSTVVMWKGWGFDYLDLMYLKFTDILEDKSKTLYFDLREDKTNNSSNYHISSERIEAIKKIKYFCPVLKEEFDLIHERHDFTKHLKYVDWMYGFDYSVNEIIEAGYVINKKEGLWLGNSATITNNHFDYLSVVEENKYLSDMMHYIPLSYGFDNYKNKIKSISNSILNDNVIVLDSFLSFDKYMKFIASSKFMVMHHIRQQALGNIWLGLLTGSTIFLNEKSPTYKYFKRNGFVIYPSSELSFKSNPEDFSLNKYERKENEKMAFDFLCDDAIKKNSKNLIEFVYSEF